VAEPGIFYHRLEFFLQKIKIHDQQHNPYKVIVMVVIANERMKALPPHLIGKLTYTFNKVLVRLPLSSNQLSHNWNHLEGVLVIHPATCRFG
jgi:hypothetical protein